MKSASAYCSIDGVPVSASAFALRQYGDSAGGATSQPMRSDGNSSLEAVPV